MRLLFIFLVLISAPLLRADERQLDIKVGDRVLLIGDTLMERENNFGYIESQMRREFPGRNFSVRNLAYSGDSPLGASRASFDPVDSGIEVLKRQIAELRPTIAVLGYGMAASLDELTYRSNDPMLNADPARYGTEHNPARFRREMVSLVELIRASSPDDTVRFVFVGPIKHEDLRAARPGLPDPGEHNALLARYEQIVEELAAEMESLFVRGEWETAGISLANGTDNGIHLNPRGMRAFSASFANQLGWKSDLENWDTETDANESLREAILRKNSLFFHRSRPANYTYIFGFRKHEQSQNAVEIPKFEALVEKAEADVIRISAGKPGELNPPPPSPTKLPDLPSLPQPEFTIDDGLEISLFAENPLLEKPVSMNWDSEGGLWVASSNTYPQINPEDIAAQMMGNGSEFGPSTGNDRIILLEDTDRDGVADTSRIVADSLLIPSGVAPDNEGGCFVGASTELLHLRNPDAAGKLSERRIVLSGFGTEDTHHIIHGLQWGIDGRLYFQQTIYIHSHIETPWGLIRANSGVTFAYDPNTERLEVRSKGLVNCWGQQEDAEGQTFLTSGADSNGISWSFPGAILPPSEGARRTMSSISPGSYPKFCGLEIINSPLFGSDWQGDAITSDFRAHRIVRFGFNDLTEAAIPEDRKSGYVTQSLPDLVRTSDAAFRPVSLKMGPDGALYAADWTNPIINHGEVDFRDPRRNKQHGRIWRIAPAESSGLDWESLTDLSAEVLLDKLLSENRWEVEQARRELAKKPLDELEVSLSKWASNNAGNRHAAWLLSGRSTDAAYLEGLLSTEKSDEVTKQVALREIGKAYARLGVEDVGAIAPWIAHDQNPRTRLEAFRALGRILTFESADLVLQNYPTDSEDEYLDFAAWTSANELAIPWLDGLTENPERIDSRENLIGALVRIADPAVFEPYVARLVANREIGRKGSGPWIELIGNSGSEADITMLYNLLLEQGRLIPEAQRRVVDALTVAATVRNLRPLGELDTLTRLVQIGDPKLQRSIILLAGEWQVEAFVQILVQIARTGTNIPQRDAAFKALRSIGGEETVTALREMVDSANPDNLREAALIPLAVHDQSAALAVLPDILERATDTAAKRQIWKPLFQNGALLDYFVTDFPNDLTEDSYLAALQIARSMGAGGADLVKILKPLAGADMTPRDYARETSAMVNALKAGADPSDGELVYRRIGCAICHAIGGVGGDFGPDLSSIGASAPLDYIIESTLNPAAKVKESYHGFSYTMKDGSVMTGIPDRETATEIILQVAPRVEASVLKAEIAEKQNIGSLMAGGMVDAVDFVSKRNLFAFLGEIGRPGPFDASQLNVARIWAFTAEMPTAGELDASLHLTTLINGQLRGVDRPDLPFATAKFSVGASTTEPLILTGVAAAWLDGEGIALSDGRYGTPIPAGEHLLTVKPDPSALAFRAKCDDITFLDISR